MKRVITIKANDGDIQVEVTARVVTSTLNRRESEDLTAAVANRLFEGVTSNNLPYVQFGVHNTKVSV